MPETPKPNTQAPPAGISGGRGFLVFKTVIYAVLILDAGLLYAYGSWREVTEQTGWLLILAAFEWESQGLGTRPDGGKHRAQRAMEITGYALAVFCWAAYAEAREWQNFANATVWLLIAAALAHDLHSPPAATGPGWRTGFKAALYLAVTAIALSWGLDGAWLDFWDAMLWLTCFFVIELRVFDFAARTRRAA